MCCMPVLWRCGGALRAAPVALLQLLMRSCTGLLWLLLKEEEEAVAQAAAAQAAAQEEGLLGLLPLLLL
jgi:hypothetical protein